MSIDEQRRPLARCRGGEIALGSNGRAAFAAAVDVVTGAEAATIISAVESAEPAGRRALVTHGLREPVTLPVARPSLPPLDEYVALLGEVWQTRMLSSFGLRRTG